MEPTLHEGDRLLVLYGVRPRLGRLALVRLPDDDHGVPRPLAVKRVTRPAPDGADGWWVERDNPREGVDSWLVGAIPTRDVRGVVVLRLPGFLRIPHRRRGRAQRRSRLRRAPLFAAKGTRMFTRLFAAPVEVSAHCDLPCGVYDPAQARIEAQSVKAIIEKAAASDDEEFKVRSILIKEERSELVKHHLWVLWTDYFKPPHFEKYPELHTLFNEATKLAGATGTKGSSDLAKADELLAKIDQIAEIFWETKKAA